MRPMTLLAALSLLSLGCATTAPPASCIEPSSVADAPDGGIVSVHPRGADVATR